MAKKGAAAAASRAAAKSAKKEKAAKKVERKNQKEKKKRSSENFDTDSDNDLEGILDKMRREWEAAHAVVEETVEGPPSRRASATLTACPNGNHLWFIGGELFSEDGKAHFYNDVYRYSPDKNEWRRFTSPTCPGPRSAHSVVATSAGGGKLFLFGGEFSSLHQTTFHHYRDFWCFEISSHSWGRIETKVKPSARSGCRMAIWKHFIVLFGGFYDPGFRTNYLNDLWLFDTQEYMWRQVEFRDTDRKPSPRSGFSFLSVPDGVILHGGYCKEYVKGKSAAGIALQDTWFLKMDTDAKAIRWERRKKTGYAPSVRSGCTMALWPARNTGVMFGGVFDENFEEEGMESMFYNDLYGYITAGSGRWVSMTLRKPKKQKGVPQQNKPVSAPSLVVHTSSDDDAEDGEQDDLRAQGPSATQNFTVDGGAADPGDEIDPNDPSLTIPLVRYNAMLAILRNTLYIYGGVFESHSREYTLDDFYALQLDRMERYDCLKKSVVVIGNDDGSSSDGDEEEEEDDEDEEGVDGIDNDGSEDGGQGAEISPTLEEIDRDKEKLRKLATAFMGVAKNQANRSEEDAVSTPLPGETLAMFYSRSREHWAQKALERSDNRGKMLRRDGFSLAEEKYASYKPILEEIQKILAEAGLDEEEMKRVGTAGSGPGGSDLVTRNRR